MFEIMSNELVENEVVKIISKLKDADIYSLANTVTQGLKKSSDRNDALRNIIKYSPSIVSILRRKLVTRELLFDYLDENNVRIQLPITKPELIDKILEFWKLTDDNSVEVVSSKNGDNFRSNETRHEDSAVNVLAKQFSQWFYTMLNSSEGVGAEHFFSDAKLKVNISTMNGDCIEQIVEDSPEEITATFSKIKDENNILFNPNITNEGTQGRMDPHGLVIVLVCGSVHVKSGCVGVFEQVFGLARDPFCENNWKVKNTQLAIKTKDSAIEAPKLCDSQLTSPLLSLPYE